MAHGKLPTTSFKKEKSPPPVQFDLGQMVWNYVLAKRILNLFMQLEREAIDGIKRIEMRDSANWFSGVLKGYDDWFEELKIDQERFDEVQELVDVGELRGQAQKVVKRICDNKEKARPKIIVPGQVPQMVEIAKERFDKVLLKGRVKK